MSVHPYRTPARRDDAPPRRGRSDPLRAGAAIACLFLLAWSVLRVALCTVRGLDIEGAIAAVIVVTAAVVLVAPSRPEASS
jgi:hypothetical protein